MTTSDIIQLFKNFNSHTDDYLGAMYMSIYHQLPQCYRIYYGNDGELHYQHSSELFFEIRKEMKYKIDCRVLLQKLKKQQERYELEIFCYSPHEYLVLGGSSTYLHYGDSRKFPHNFLMNITLSQDAEMADFYEEVFCQAEDIEPIMEMLKKNCVQSTKKDKIEFGIAAIDASNNIYTSWYDYEDKKIDV